MTCYCIDHIRAKLIEQYATSMCAVHSFPATINHNWNTNRCRLFSCLCSSLRLPRFPDEFPLLKIESLVTGRSWWWTKYIYMCVWMPPIHFKVYYILAPFGENRVQTHSVRCSWNWATRRELKMSSLNSKKKIRFFYRCFYIFLISTSPICSCNSWIIEHEMNKKKLSKVHEMKRYFFIWKTHALKQLRFNVEHLLLAILQDMWRWFRCV